MDISNLEGLGLSKGEIKIYVILLELGSTKVGSIIEKSGLASSMVHNALNSLINKGLVSYIKKGMTKFYQAAPPSQIVDFIETKKKNVMKILPELELKQKLAGEKNDAEIFLGTKGLITMLNMLIDDAKKGDKYLFFATSLLGKDEEIQKFFNRYDMKRKEKGLIIKGIASNDFKKYFEGRKMLKMKFTNFPIPSDVSICKNNVALISWGENPMGVLVRSKKIYEMFNNYFDLMWKMIK